LTAARTPANSETVVAKLATSSAVIASSVILTPYSSRMRSARPLPVTAAMRAAISWQTPSETVVTTSTQTIR
jgi:hypothetical protein